MIDLSDFSKEILTGMSKIHKKADQIGGEKVGVIFSDNIPKKFGIIYAMSWHVSEQKQKIKIYHHIYYTRWGQLWSKMTTKRGFSTHETQILLLEELLNKHSANYRADVSFNPLLRILGRELELKEYAMFLNTPQMKEMLLDDTDTTKFLPYILNGDKVEDLKSVAHTFSKSSNPYCFKGFVRGEERSWTACGRHVATKTVTALGSPYNLMLSDEFLAIPNIVTSLQEVL